MKKFDLFPATQFLRYKQESEYKTATGGFISIAAIIICLILFYSLGIQTLSKQIIYGQTTNKIQIEPDPLKITFGNGSEFMFCFGIRKINLINTSKKYFNITLRQNFYGPLQRSLINSTDVPLVPCTPQHFSQNSETRAFYDKFYLSQTLCPSIDYEFTVGGRQLSQVYSQFAVYIERCNQTIDANCVSDADLLAKQKEIGGFNFYSPLINTIVNPGNAEYKQIYIEQRNVYEFTTELGLWMNAEIQQYQIDTDVSLLPYTDIQTQYVTAMPELFRVRPKQIFGNRYVQLIFSKSSTSTQFARSFNKIDNYLSYIGGLISTLLLFFFLLGKYSQASFIISLSSQIYRSKDEGQPQEQPKFNFLHYLSINFQQFFQYIIKFKKGETSKFIKVIDEMQKQLDIAYLLKRVNFCEEAITSILYQDQIKALDLKGKKSIKEAAQLKKKSKKQETINNKICNINTPFELRPNESSIEYILDPQIKYNVVSNQHPPQLYRGEQVDQPEISSSQQQQGHKQVNSKKAKQTQIQVIKNSKSGDLISRRIQQKNSKKIFPQIGIDLQDNLIKQIVQVKSSLWRQQKKNQREF